MDDSTATRWVENLTWEESEEAFQTADFVVLPCGSTEQHSTHLPMSVDTIRAHHLTDELLSMAPEYGMELLALPTLPIGYSEHHMNYPGTLSLTYETYIDVIVEIGECVATHGVTDLVLLNAHAGNIEPHKLAMDRLQRETDLSTYYVHWTDYAREDLEERFGTEWGHAGEYETSQIELFRPDAVRTENKERQRRPNRFTAHPFAYFDEITEQGGLGDPRKSDPEAMRTIIESATGSILESLETDFRSVHETDE